MGAIPVIISDLDSAPNRLPELLSRAGLRLGKAPYALVKPNICGLYHPKIDLLSRLIESLLPFSELVVIGETRSMVHDPEEQFKRLGVTALTGKFGRRLRLIDLSDDRSTKIRIPHPHALNEVDLPTTALKAEVLINLAKMGIHSSTRITGALKNLFGLLPEKHKYSVYHPLGMNEVVADIAQIVKPSLNIVEVKDRVVLGVDALAVDIVACRLFNIDPSSVEHFQFTLQDRLEEFETFSRKIRVMDSR
jgi:uncharacterized protein (DUF362 family)